MIFDYLIGMVTGVIVGLGLAKLFADHEKGDAQ